MALGNLTLSFKERNDKTALVITDTTGTSDSTAWGVGANIDYTDIDGSSYDMTLDITVTTSDGSSTVYDTIDLYDEFGAFVNYEDLTFTITADMLFEDGVTAFDSGDEIPDGVYDLTYTVTNAGTAGADVEKEYSILVYGKSKVGTYELLRQIENIYELQGDLDSREVREAIFASSYLEGIENSDKEEALNQLLTLENIIRNGSTNPW